MSLHLVSKKLLKYFKLAVFLTRNFLSSSSFTTIGQLDSHRTYSTYIKMPTSSLETPVLCYQLLFEDL